MMELRKSINIKYDINDETLISDYFATSSHSQIIKNVFLGALGSKQRSHIAFGPYGAGKSYISTIITGFLGKKYNDVINKSTFINKFKVVDTEIANLFEEVSNMGMTFIPILINGFEGRFEDTLIKYIIEKTKSYVDIKLDDDELVVREIIEKWKNHYISAYLDFSEYLKSIQLTESEFLTQISQNEVLESFKHFYQTISFGSTYPSSQKLDLIETFETISDELKAKNLGIILVYDEFGRMLQNLDHREINSFMQSLQDLAELANNRCTNLNLLFVAHKPISHYFSYLDKDRRQEFSKIEKRFTITNINSDNTTFIYITSRLLAEKSLGKISNGLFNFHKNNLRKYRFFSSSFNETEIEEIIIKSSYPIHPISLYLLPLISKIFGQNERSLFSFILDKSNLGVFGIIDKNPEIESITPDFLVDYFFNDSALSEENEIVEFSIYKNNYKLIETKLGSGDIKFSESIYKFMMLWNLTKSGTHTPISAELISYALNLKKELVERQLELLSQINIIRFNSTVNNWQLINSDTFDFQNEYLKRKYILSSHKELVFQTLNIYNPHRYVYSNQHNNDYQITRFGVVHFLSPENLSEPIITEQSDFKIYVHVGSHVEKLTDPQVISCGIGNLEDAIVDCINKLSIIDILIKDRQFLIENKSAQSELDYEKTKLLKSLSSFYDKIFSNNFYNFHLSTHTSDLLDFENYLDKLSSIIFSKTVLIQNDQINMFRITKQQENPTIQIIGMILENESFDLDNEFEGNKPDHLIYYSLKHANLSELELAIQDYLEKHPTGYFSELTSIATAPPFGIRPTLSSIIVLMATIDRWKNMMFYRNNSYIANIEASNLYKAGLGAYDFEYTYSQFDFENFEFFGYILKQFNFASEGVQKKSISIQVLSALNNWYISLPVITQTGTMHSIKAMSFIGYIKKAKVDPIHSLSNLINSFQKEDIDEVKYEIENAFNLYLDNFEEEILNEFKVDSWKEFVKPLNVSILKSNLLARLADGNVNVIQNYAEEIEQIEIERWPQAMFDMLRNRIREDYYRTKDKVDSTAIVINGISKSVNNVNLSMKASTLKRNLENLINANTKYITRSEVEKIVLELIDKYIK